MFIKFLLLFGIIILVLIAGNLFILINLNFPMCVFMCLCVYICVHAHVCDGVCACMYTCVWRPKAIVLQALSAMVLRQQSSCSLPICGNKTPTSAALPLESPCDALHQAFPCDHVG